VKCPECGSEKSVIEINSSFEGEALFCEKCRVYFEVYSSVPEWVERELEELKK